MKEAMITVWGRRTSSNTQKVIWLLEEIGQPYRVIELGGRFGGLDRPEFRRLNPNGLIPVVEDDGYVLWESNAILRYLADAYGRGVLRTVPLQSRGLVDQWMDWQQTIYAPACLDAYVQMIRVPPERRDLAALSASQERTRAAMSILDHQLARTEYVAGDAFTLADVTLGIMAHRYSRIVPDHPEVANVLRWHRLLDRRAPFRTAVSSIELA
jgi:glutathione S-transferase